MGSYGCVGYDEIINELGVRARRCGGLSCVDAGGKRGAKVSQLLANQSDVFPIDKKMLHAHVRTPRQDMLVK